MVKLGPVLGSALVASSVTLATSARADLTPPGKSDTVVELSLQNKEGFPGSGFVVVGCWPAIPPGVGFARGNESVRCLPHGSMTVFAVPRADFDALSANPFPKGGLTTIGQRGKSCGNVANEDVSFSATSDVAVANVTYALEAGDDGSCRMHRVSVDTLTRAEQRARSQAPAPAPSTPSTSPSADAKDSTSPRATCGACAVTTHESSPAPFVLVAALLLLARRRRARRGRHSEKPQRWVLAAACASRMVSRRAPS